MKIDPFFIKRLPKWHLKRLFFTLNARLQEYLSRCFFEEYALPLRTLDPLPPPPDANWSETQVKPEEARYLLRLLRETEPLSGCALEVGSWRGETTAYMAANTKRTFVAIDPWIGDRNDMNFQAFRKRTANLANVRIERKTFGRSVRDWNHGPVSFAFIDAAHDYMNVAHDLAAVQGIMISRGVIALHDTDNIAFAGCRRAVYEAAEKFELLAHLPNLTIFRIRA